jgi:hypothetical protein
MQERSLLLAIPVRTRERPVRDGTPTDFLALFLSAWSSTPGQLVDGREGFSRLRPDGVTVELRKAGSRVDGPDRGGARAARPHGADVSLAGPGRTPLPGVAWRRLVERQGCGQPRLASGA